MTDTKALGDGMQPLSMSQSQSDSKMTARDILPTPDEEAALTLLKDRGWTVKKHAVYRKRTFEVDEEVHRVFRDLQERLGLKVKDAFNEALRDWIMKHSKKP